MEKMNRETQAALREFLRGEFPALIKSPSPYKGCNYYPQAWGIKFHNISLHGASSDAVTDMVQRRLDQVAKAFGPLKAYVGVTHSQADACIMVRIPEAKDPGLMPLLAKDRAVDEPADLELRSRIAKDAGVRVKIDNIPVTARQLKHWVKTLKHMEDNGTQMMREDVNTVIEDMKALLSVAGHKL